MAYSVEIAWASVKMGKGPENACFAAVFLKGQKRYPKEYDSP